MKSHCRRRVALLLFISLLAACSGIKTYPNTLDKNLNIRTDTHSNEFLGKVKADVDIYRVDANCEDEYLGTADARHHAQPRER